MRPTPPLLLPLLQGALFQSLLLALAGCAPEGPVGGPGAPAESTRQAAADWVTHGPEGTVLPVTGEVLLADPPPGWVESGTLISPVMRMAEYVPAEQAAAETADPSAPLSRVTFESQAGDPLPDPIEFVLGLSKDLTTRCEGFSEFNIMSGLENGYATSVRLMICPRFRERNMGEVLMVKAIQGREHFYTVTRGRRLPAFEPGDQALDAQTMAEWSSYLKAVRVCDPRWAEHACPEHVETSTKRP